MTERVAIGPARSQRDLDDFAALVREYVDWLAVDLGYQGLEAALGGVAVKPLPALGSGICEMKRLYVRPAGRGLGLGRRLGEAAMVHARAAGFTAMVLDTMPSRMGEAVAMYTKLGFTARAAYYDTPVEETIFLEAPL